MDLKDFVAESLIQVIDGVREAQLHASQNGAYIAREGYFMNEAKGMGKDQSIDFDIAVTVQESSEKEGKAGLKIPFVEAGGGVNAAKANSSISRIQFAVPIMLPAQKVK